MIEALYVIAAIVAVYFAWNLYDSFSFPCLHLWSKWKMIDIQYKDSACTKQKRVCSKCGAIQIKDLYI